MDLGPPFWDPSSDPPPENTKIGQYVVLSNAIPKPTNCSYIYYCTDSTDNDNKKIIKFIKLIERKIPRINNEIETLSITNHKNIIKMENCFRFGKYMCIIFPNIPNGSLHRLIMNQYRTGIPEDMASVIMRQMLKAVEYLHGNNIWHRDIKPDNFLVVDADPNHPVVVLNDFGFAKVFDKGEEGKEFMGTPEFLPPEMINGVPYDNSVDIWSLGISLFVMLTGRYATPSYSKYPHRCRKMISQGILFYHVLTDMNISNEAIDLIRQMCTFDPKSRITATKALQHPWILSATKSSIEQEVADAIKAGEDYQSQIPNFV